MKKILSVINFFIVIISFLLTITLTIVVTTQKVSATQYYWVGGYAANWSTASNWKLNSFSGTTATTAPLSTDSVYLGNGSTSATVTLNADTAITALFIQGSGQIFINGSTKTLRVTGDLSSTNTNTTGGGSATIKITGTSNQSLSGNTSATNKGKFCNITID